MPEKKKILIIDDEPLIANALEGALQRWNYRVELSQDGKKAISNIKKENYDMVLTDMRMPGISGMEVLEEVKKQSPETGVVMVTAFGTIDQAVEAMKKGAFDYITKPFSLDEIKICMTRYFQSRLLHEENKNLKRALKEKYALENFVGQNAKIKAMFKSLETAFESDASVLINSENGTGKELIASAIHYNSSRKGKPFIRINCASIPENLIESQLFGHERGAFTGATNNLKGVFEEADNGTLLLDEVTEMPPHLQPKLLRVLQEGEYSRLGSNQVMQSDVRIIATTNSNVQKAIESGMFRQDLYFRLNVLSINIPPLRERKDDIPLLCEHFMRKYAKKYNKKVSGVDKAIYEYLYKYDWPGNVRELENFIQRSILSCKDSEEIAVEHILNHLPDANLQSNSQKKSLLEEDLSISEMEKVIIENTLKRHHYHKTKTAEILGVTLKTLRAKILQYGILDERVRRVQLVK